MTKEEQKQAVERQVKQNRGGAVGEAALSADEQTNGQTRKPGISDATNAIVEKTDEAAVRNVKQPATQNTLVDADTQQANKENAIGRLLQSRMQANEAEQQKLEENYQAQQKRKKRNAIISSIADGLSALSNMYFTSKGAPTPTKQAASMSEQQAKQNVADRNTYLELLQGWRKRNNKLLDNYVTYQATAAKNKLTQQRLAFEADKEARLWAKQKAQEAYNAEYLKLKKEGLDDNSAKWKAQLAQDEAELKALNDYRRQQIALGYYKADISAAPTVTNYEGVSEDGIYHLTQKTQQKDLKINANGRQK